MPLVSGQFSRLRTLQGFPTAMQPAGVERVTTLPAPMVQCLMYFSAAPYLLSLHPVLQLNLRYAGKMLFVFSNQNEAVCNGCRAYQ